MKNYSSKTKANFHRKSKFATPLKAFALLVVALLLLLILGSFLGFLGSFVTQPLYFVRAWIAESASTVPQYFENWNELLAEVETLERQLDESRGTSASLERVLHENDELRSLLNIEEEIRIAAGILARPPYLPYDSLMIDRGSNDGVTENAIVYHASDQAIGFISKVFSESSLVTLFSSPGIESSAYILGPDIFARAHGYGGGIIRISVPQGIKLTEGDIVTLPTLERGIIGKIGEIRSISTEPEQHAFVIPDAPLQSLQYVGVGSRTIKPITFEEAVEIVDNLNYDDLLIDIPEEMLYGGDLASTTATTSNEQGN